jgi:hypothetical protein
MRRRRRIKEKCDDDDTNTLQTKNGTHACDKPVKKNGKYNNKHSGSTTRIPRQLVSKLAIVHDPGLF